MSGFWCALLPTSQNQKQRTGVSAPHGLRPPLVVVAASEIKGGGRHADAGSFPSSLRDLVPLVGTDPGLNVPSAALGAGPGLSLVATLGLGPITTQFIVAGGV
jgi:hypothetical protein